MGITWCYCFDGITSLHETKLNRGQQIWKMQEISYATIHPEVVFEKKVLMAREFVMTSHEICDNVKTKKRITRMKRYTIGLFKTIVRPPRGSPLLHCITIMNLVVARNQLCRNADNPHLRVDVTSHRLSSLMLAHDVKERFSLSLLQKRVSHFSSLVLTYHGK